MKVTVLNKPDLSDKNIHDQVIEAISSSLKSITTIGDKFIINDSLWYFPKRRGGVAPCVVNSASFISSRFQKALSTIDRWQGETTIQKQSFDGFGELKLTGFAYSLNKEHLMDVLETTLKANGADDSAIGTMFTRFYGMYIKRTLFDIQQIPEKLHSYFIQHNVNQTIRVGVEFETGNIASSFRALQKLDYLFSNNEIDAGVFVTSLNKKDCAARIWPTSNRNGSFSELAERNYRQNVALPLWEIGFQPDDFRDTAPYLGSDGSTFTPTKTGKTKSIGKKRYEIWIGENGEQLLKLIKE